MKKLLYSCGAIILFFSAFSFSAHSQQCSGCTMSALSGIDSTNYTISSGQTLCIPSGTLVRGNITISGGAICNAGVLAPSSLTINSGTITNNGTVRISSSYTLNGTGAITIANDSAAAFNIAGDLTFSSGNFTNSGTLNVSGNILLNSGSLTNNGTLNYMNMNNNSGAAYTNNGTANCCGN